MIRSNLRRAGFTLVELMVVMGIIALLATMVMLIAPNVLAKDRARDAASQLQGALQNARMRAMRDGMPRGVRLLLDPPAPANATGRYAHMNAANGQRVYTFATASTYQYIEVPPWLIFVNQNGLPGNPGQGQTPAQPPYLQFNYTIAPKAIPPSPPGTVTTRNCIVGGLSLTQANQVLNIVNYGFNTGQNTLPPILYVPGVSFWSSVIPTAPIAYTTVNTNPVTYQITLPLSVYPDTAMGSATVWRTPSEYTGTAYFGIYQTPRPLLGEPVLQMPAETTVDLSDGLSSPSFNAIGGFIQTGKNRETESSAVPGYDILFSPSGQLMSPVGVGQVYLWVRDPTKGSGTAIPNPNTDQGAFYSMSPYEFATGWNGQGTVPYGGANSTFPAALPQYGEQLLVSIRANSGGTGVSPIFWPTAAGQNPYYFAVTAANSP